MTGRSDKAKKDRKERKRRLWIRFLPPLLTVLLRIVAGTLRWRFCIPEESRCLIESGRPLVLAFWHGHIFLLPGVFQRVFPKRSEIWTLISRHWDGELIARTVKPFGVHAIRGSTGKGGKEALQEMLQTLAEGRRVAITPDGPRGPRRKLQPGVVLLSGTAQAPILPVAWSASPCLRMKSWDRFEVPLPFGRVCVTFGVPLTVPDDEARADLRSACARVEHQMNDLCRRAETERAATAQSDWLAVGYNFLLALLLVPSFPFFVWKLATTPKHRVGLAQRLGLSLPSIPRQNNPTRPIWIHAVSVGEVLATVPLVRKLRQTRPDQPVVISTITPTAQAVARRTFPEVQAVIYFPFDLPFCVRRVLRSVRPRLFIHTETEIWPNFLLLLGREGIPSLIINGRISARSCRQYGWFRFFFREVLRSVSAFGMQSRADCRRIIRIGADPRRVFVTGNMKFDLPLEEEPEILGLTMRRELGFRQEDPVWVAGSTHSGEEEIVLDVFVRLRASFPALRLLLAPRHTERAAEIETLARSKGLAVARRTHGAPAAIDAQVLLMDTMGELAKAYAAADLVFVGGSLVPVGGHNLLEPILLGKPVLFGRHTQNTADIARALQEAGGGIEVYDADSLYHQAVRLLSSRADREALARSARSILEESRGATERNLEMLERFLPC